ncbi:HNH endonuclease signature motif containing protein [Corynebacterium sp.]|uniref:HNH endonuclease signature motif containing protein n=1 Tax=Corynebacterium sp. TaxID=1720 RepID=UPI0026DF79F2|nr:HNH endonuclease signature motif containing protein [Corynebacterium sp.]MDO5511554.1 HNH endonuclease signature motif containing protein [Corynebacterium sp.]
MATASWSVLDESNSYRAVRQANLRAEYEMWRSCQPEVVIRDEEDWTALTAELYSKLGMTKYQITRRLDALEVLDRLPRLKRLVEETFLLDMGHLCVIEKEAAMAAIALQDDDFFWKALDEDLMARFTPSRPRQMLPSSTAISDVVKGTIRSVELLAAPQEDPWSEGTPVDPDAPEKEGPEPCENPGELMSTLPVPEAPPQSTLHVEDLPAGDIRIELVTDQATGTEILEAIDQAASDRECSKAEALTSLILDDVTTKATMMLYQAEGEDESVTPVFHPERGLLTPQAAAALRKRVTRTISMRHAKTATTGSYRPTPEIRAYLIGRDWRCRWPGCNRKATRCDADHRINHDDGGPTTASNMVMLCRHHHNRKTDQEISYLLDPHTGDVYWLFADGTYAVDEATGPLAPKLKRWVRSYRQRLRGRREYLAAKAAGERFEAYQEKMNSPPPEPPDRPEHHLSWMGTPEDDPPPF